MTMKNWRQIVLLALLLIGIPASVSAEVLYETVESAHVMRSAQEAPGQAKDRAVIAAREKALPVLAEELKRYWGQQRPGLLLRDDEYQAAAMALSSLTLLKAEEVAPGHQHVDVRLTLLQADADSYLQHFALPSLLDGRRTLAQWNDLRLKYRALLQAEPSTQVRPLAAYLLLERGHRQVLALEKRTLDSLEQSRERMMLTAMGAFLGQPVSNQDEMMQFFMTLFSGMMNDFMQASTYYKESLEAYPTTAAYCERALCLLIQMEPQKAKAEIERAIVLDPSDPRVHTMRALVLLANSRAGLRYAAAPTAEQAGLAAAELDQAIARQPEQAWLYSDRALLRLYAGATEAALEDWREYLKRSPQLRGSLLQLAYAVKLESCGHPYRAMREYTDYLAVVPRGDFFRSAVLNRLQGVQEQLKTK